MVLAMKNNMFGGINMIEKINLGFQPAGFCMYAINPRRCRWAELKWTFSPIEQILRTTQTTIK